MIVSWYARCQIGEARPASHTRRAEDPFQPPTIRSRLSPRHGVTTTCTWPSVTTTAGIRYRSRRIAEGFGIRMYARPAGARAVSCAGVAGGCIAFSGECAGSSGGSTSLPDGPVAPPSGSSSSREGGSIRAAVPTATGGQSVARRGCERNGRGAPARLRISPGLWTAQTAVRLTGAARALTVALRPADRSVADDLVE